MRKSLGTLPEGISEAVGVSTATSCSDPESSVEQPCESNSSESNDTPTHDPAKDDCKLCGSAAAGRWVYMRNCTCAFHGKCLETWRLDGHNLCPQCDVPISATLFYADFLGEHVTTEVGVVGCECEKQGGSRILNVREFGVCSSLTLFSCFSSSRSDSNRPR